MDYETFSRLVIVGQGFKQRFTEMNDRALKEFIESLTGSLLYAKAHGIAKDRLDAIVADLEKLESVRGSLLEQSERAQTQVSEEQEKVDKAEEERQANLQELVKDVNAHQYEIAQIRETNERINGERDANVAQYDQQVSDWQAHVSTLNEKLASVSQQQGQAKIDLRLRQGAEIEELDQGINALRAKQRAQMEEAEAVVSEANGKRDAEIQASGQARQSLLQTMQEALQPLQDEHETLQSEIQAFRAPQVPPELLRSLATAEGRLQALDERINKDMEIAGKKCPTCGKDVTEEDARKQISENYDPDALRTDIVHGPDGIEASKKAIQEAEQQAQTETERQEKVRQEAADKHEELQGRILADREAVAEFDEDVARIPDRHKPVIEAADKQAHALRVNHERELGVALKAQQDKRNEHEIARGVLDEEHNAANVGTTTEIAQAEGSLQQVQGIRQKYIDDVGDVLAKHGQQLQGLEDNVNILELEIVQTNARDLAAVLRTLESNLAHAQQQVEENERKSKEMEDARYLYDYLTTAFGLGGIRSYMLDSILSYLNERLKEHCQAIFDGYVQVELSPVHQQKNKAIVEKISLNVTTDGAAYDLSSGGECRKIDVVLFLAFRDLNRVLSPIKVNLEAYDEMLEGLDGEAARRVIQLLASDPSVETKILITHRADVPIIAPHYALQAVKQDRVTSYIPA
jgi:DNA repair exonuclease SbcCD ATPase subunit